MDKHVFRFKIRNIDFDEKINEVSGLGLASSFVDAVQYIENFSWGRSSQHFAFRIFGRR